MEFLINWIAATPGYAAPLLLASLGLIINERAGVLNLGAEGMMACGALAGAAISLTTGWPSLGILAAMIAGGLMAALFGVVTVYLRANQVVTGLVVVALGAGVTGVLGRDYVSQTLPGFKALSWGGLADIAIIGPILFKQNIMTYLAFVTAGLVWFGLFKTLTGLRLRAAGEDPATADACGSHVLLIRFFAVMAGGALCGAAGGYLTLASSYIWVEGMIAGRGWIAIGLVIFARWRPKIAMLGALLFGAIEALVPRILATGADIPIYALMMLPYLATLGVLVAASLSSRRRSSEPGSLGTPYNRQDRH
jgi:simple sugar transport system permease protein